MRAEVKTTLMIAETRFPQRHRSRCLWKGAEVRTRVAYASPLSISNVSVGTSSTSLRNTIHHQDFRRAIDTDVGMRLVGIEKDAVAGFQNNRIVVLAV